jgi:hypothetical protein
MPMIMSERKAAQWAKKIYADHKSGKLTDSKASEMLSIVSLYFSETQFNLYLDWSGFVRANPNFFKKA